MKPILSLFLTLVLLLTGCTGLPGTISTPSVDATIQPQSPKLTASAWSLTTPSPTPQSPHKIRVWVPPQFDPASDTPAGKLLQSRLNEFQSHTPDVAVEIRIKALSGPGGLLDSLTAASAAAPQALPDLIALPRDLLETAALKGLLLSLDTLTTALDDPDWYPFAAEMARLQKNVYGLPFAGDALVQVYRPGRTPEPPATLKSTLDLGSPLIFPAADDQPFFPLALYAASGGAVSDEQGRPYLSTLEMTQVLTFCLSAQKLGVMPSALLTQLQDDEQVWKALIGNRTGLAITWASRFLANQTEELALSPIPTPDGQPFTLATGWVWALAGRDEGKQKITLDLAEFLTDSHFLAEWTQAIGYLPTRPSSLDLWLNASFQETFGAIAMSAHLLPPADVLTSLQTPMQQAVLSVLNGQSDPALAAQTAASGLTSP